MNARQATGASTASSIDPKLVSYINVKLALLGCAPAPAPSASDFTEIASALIARCREEERLLSSYQCPSDQRIQTFLYDYLQQHLVTKLPQRTFVLDRPGLARILSLPIGRDELALPIVHSYRVKQGILHNPRSDRRTTAGIFHICFQAARGGFVLIPLGGQQAPD